MSLKLNISDRPAVLLSSLRVTDLFREEGRVYMVSGDEDREDPEAPFIPVVALQGAYATALPSGTYVEPLVGELTIR